MIGASTYTVTVSEDKAGMRLDRLLADAIPGLSRTRLQALIADGFVEIPGREPIRDPARRVVAAEVFAVVVPPAAPAAPRPQPIPIDVVYEDAHLIIVDKPAGLVVHPAAGNPDGTLVNALLAHCPGGLSGIGGDFRPGIVHRLDKETSGLIVVAKSDEAHLGLVRQFSEHSVERAYHAAVWGVPRPGRGRIDMNVGRCPTNRKKMAVVTRGGKPAVTQYSVSKAFGGYASLVECRLATGRTHQIRVHLAAIGHPLLGDAVYGGGRNRVRTLPEPMRSSFPLLRGQALHAYLIGIRHPVTAERLRFESKLPQQFRALLEFLDPI
jgi:23S rRNA pseudouridine1911/1915/1917 synthase